MLRSFIIITLRILWRNKVTSFINIFSLAIGMTAFILIMLYVHHEFSYDKFNEHYDRIYRVEAGEYGKFPPIIGEYLKNEIPGIENVSRLAVGALYPASYIPEDNPESIISVDVNLAYADSTIFSVFTLPFIHGNPRKALRGPFTTVLTEETSKKLFGGENPVGRTINCDNYDFMVTGVIKDIEQSHIDINALFSMESFAKQWPDRNINRVNSSGWAWSATYLLIGDKADPIQIEAKINQVLSEINDGILINAKFDNFTIRPLKEVYFKGAAAILPNQFGRIGNLKQVQTFMAIAIFILILACVNYINLTTARASLRTKEVAMKKIVGSSKSLLRKQFISESILVTLISFLIGFTFIQLLMPQFNQLAMISIDRIDLNTPIFWFLSIIGICVIGTISGLYPALYLTTINSAALIKEGSLKGSKGANFRKALLTFQFSISILLIIGVITSMRQINFARTMDLGFDKDYILQIEVPYNFPEKNKKYTLIETIKERLEKNSGIHKISFTSNTFGGQLPPIQAEIEGKEITLQELCIDPDFIELMGIEIVEGRGFSWDIKGDCRLYWDNKGDLRYSKIGRHLCNETAANLYKESPVGIHTVIGSDSKSFQYEIIGVVEDFHYQSVHHEIAPVFFSWYDPQYLMNIKISPTNIPETIKYIENEWRNVYGSIPLNYTFLDETFDKQYKRDEQGTKIIGYFTVLAIIIACMGLFALSSFMATRRTKEIGIRKAMGASSQGIFLLLSKEFLKWVLFAVIIASPVAWIVMKKWLEGFAYKINLGVDIFILAAVIAILIALATVTWQSLKTALANPVEALRYE